MEIWWSLRYDPGPLGLNESEAVFNERRRGGKKQPAPPNFKARSPSTSQSKSHNTA